MSRASSNLDRLKKEDIVVRFMKKFEHYIESNPDLAYRFISMATMIYHGDLDGHLLDKDTDRRFNKILYDYLTEPD